MSRIEWLQSALDELARIWTRVLIVPPLGIRFEVDTQQRAVTVVHVWTFRQRR